jgi:hypothetical protein
MYYYKQLVLFIWQDLAKALGENSTLESVNVESNYLTGEGIKCVMQVLRNNAIIKELRIANQVCVLCTYELQNPLY